MAGGNAVARLLIDVAFDGAQAGAQADSLASKFSNMAKTIVASALGIGGALGAAGLLKSAITASSDLEQAMGGVEAVFKDSAGVIHEWAGDTSDSFRLPQAEASQFAAVVGSQLKQAGFAMRDLAPETQKLIELGGDLASTFGGTTSDAVTALSAALRGEIDPIERYGVAINQAMVEAKAMEIAQGDAAKAAEQSTIMQARLALVYEQTADAQGQAARESQTFAASQEKLSGAFNTLLTALGGPILQAAADFLSFLADILKGIEPLISAIGSLMGWFTQLPGPVQAAGLALAGLALFMGPALLTVFKAFILLIPALITGMGGMSAATGRLGVALAALSARFTSVGTAARGFGLATIGLAGGWGLAIAGAVALATFALMSWVDANREAEAAMQETASATDAFFEILKGARDDLEGVTSGKALRLKAFDLMTEDFKEHGKSVRETADLINEALGQNAPQAMQTMITGLSGNGREGQQVIDAFNTSIAKLREEATKPVGVHGAMIDTGVNDEKIAQLEKLRDGYTNMTPSIEAARDRFDAYNAVVGETPEEDKAASVEELEGALKAAQAAAKAAFEGGFGSAILAEFSDQAKAAARAAEIFNAVTDAGAGRNRDYQQSTLDMAAGLDDVKGAFKEAADAGQLNKDALLNWDIGGLANAGDKSRALTSSLLDLSAQYGVFVTQAFESGKATSSAADAQGKYNDGLAAAHVAADQARNDFMGMAQAAGLTADEAAVLADKLGIVGAAQIDDKKFDIIAQDQEAMMTMKLWEQVKLEPVTKRFIAEVPAAQTLADQMNAEIDRINATVPVTPEVGAPTTTDQSPAAAAAAGQTPGMTPVQVTPQVGAPTTAGSSPAAAAAATGQAQTTPPVTTPSVVTPPVAPPGPVGAAAATGAAQTGGQVTVGVEAPAIPDISAGLADIAASNVTVIIAADTTQAWSAVQLFKTASVVPAVVKINADPAQANNVIRAVIGGQYSTTVHLQGDSVPVNNVIRAVIGGQYSTTVHINGDSVPVNNTLRAIIGGSYSATVYIRANADGFYSVWNSLPTSRTITVTVNQVQGSVVSSAPAPALARAATFAAPSMMMARGFAAPTVASGPQATTSGGGGGSSANITIQVGVGDPDAIARAVKRVLVGRDRRTGGVVVGQMRGALA